MNNHVGVLGRLAIPEGFVGLDDRTLPRVEAWAAGRESAGISRRRTPTVRKVEEEPQKAASAPPFRPRRPRSGKERNTSPTSWRQLDATKEHALIQRYQAGDNGAGDILLLAHEPLVLGYARGFMAQVGDVDGLLQSARMGLLDAADRFHPGQGAAFATYAVWWIRHAMIRFTEDEEHTIGMPASVQEIVKRAKREGATTAEEAFAMTGEATVLHAWPLLNGGVFAIDADVVDEKGDYGRRLPEPSSTDPSPEASLIEQTGAVTHRAIVEEALGRLSTRDAWIFRRLHLDEDPPTHDALAATLGMTRSRVGQIASEAYRKVVKVSRTILVERGQP